jgi:hypothetical protein
MDRAAAAKSSAAAINTNAMSLWSTCRDRSVIVRLLAFAGFAHFALSRARVGARI